MRLIFIHGAPAVGKLTVARELAELTGLPLFHNHLAVDVLTPLFEFGSPSFVKLRELIWLSVFQEAAKNDVSLIFTFAPERTVRPSFIQDTITTVEARGGVVHFVRLTCSAGEIEQRLARPSRAEFGKLQSLEQYQSLTRAGAFDYPELPAALTVDTGAVSPRDAAVTIRAFLARDTAASR
jgi:chloramphenicol 3-O-phosphotransferase